MDVSLHALQNSPYIPVGEPRNISGRLIAKYMVEHFGDRERIIEATNVVLKLLANNPQFCPTFPTQPRETLEEIVQRDIYLTINGQAISLAQMRMAAGDAPSNYKDRYFSEGLIDEPVRCPQNHLFERSRAHFWAIKMQNKCPVKGDHFIGDLTIDEELQEDIGGYRSSQEEQEQKMQNVVDRQRVLQLYNNSLAIQQNCQQQQINFLRGIQKIDPWLAAASSGKVLIKAGGKKIIVTLCKTLSHIITKEETKEAGKAVGKSIAKKIPFTGLFIGIGLAIYRCTQGQYYRGLAEIASGSAVCLPKYGKAISVILDFSLGAYDMNELNAAHKGEFIPAVEIDVSQAYQGLEIDLTAYPEPPRALVDQQYRRQALLLAADRPADLKKFNQQQYGEMQAFLNLCRDEICRVRGWA